MTNVLENILIMAALTALVLIPILIIKRRSANKKSALLDSRLAEISSEHNLMLTRKDRIGNLLLAYSDNRKLVVLNLLDLSHELIDLEKVKTVQEDINYDGKEVKDVMLVLSFKDGSKKEIRLYKQYDNSESELASAKKIAETWASLLNQSI